MEMKNRKIQFRKHSIPLITLILALAMVGTVFATAYVVLQWTTTATVVANPKVSFMLWSTSAKVNTFNYAVNIFPSVTTMDENITYGLWNWDTATHNVYIRWLSLTTPANVAKLGLKVYNATSTLYDQYWTSVPSFPTAWVQLNPTPAINTKYAIYMNITATGSPSGSSVFTFDMKVENP